MCVNWTKWTRITRATPAEQNTVLRRKVVHPCSSDDYFRTGVGLKGSCCCEVCGSRDAAAASPLCLSPRLHCCCSSHSLTIGWSMMLNPPPPKRSGANQPPVPPPPPHFRRGRSIQTPLVFHYNLALFVCFLIHFVCYSVGLFNLEFLLGRQQQNCSYSVVVVCLLWSKCKFWSLLFLFFFFLWKLLKSII